MRLAYAPLLLITLLAAGFGWSGCNPGEPKPVEIVLSEDSCSVCRMAVSQRRFAAELVSPSGHVDYFDDIGCLAEFVRWRGADTGSGLFVVDFNTEQWLAAEQAHYLWAKELPTPMSYGLAAFADRAAADLASQQWPGRVLDWETLSREWQP